MPAAGFDLRTFTLDDVGACSDGIRGVATDAGSMEEAAQRIARYLYEQLVDGETGRPACALVRVYKTHRRDRLEPGLAAFVAGLPGSDELATDVRCLTLLGTAGELPAWNSRHDSVGHQAIPLPSVQMVQRLPMIDRLMRQLGVDVGALVEPDPGDASALAGRAYDVFHVEQAHGSPHIPAQDFVEAHGIVSAVGFGGFLYTGDLYAVLLFAKVPVDRTVAERLRILSLALRVPLLRFGAGQVFAPPG